MRTTNNRIIASYYLLIALALGVKIFTTVYAGSMVIDHGKKIALLEDQKKELEYRKSILTGEIAQNKSLHRLTSLAESGNYSPISNPIVLTHSANVASAL